MTSALEICATLLALAYVVLAIRERRICFVAGAISAALYLHIFWQVQLYMEALLQLFYIGLSVYGWVYWRSNSSDGQVIVSWRWQQHAAAITAIFALTAVLGLLLRQYTDAALPFVDSFTTVAALLTSWMVARKVLENWLYWIVIDLVAAGMYIERELWLTAGLFALYTVLAFAGYSAWRQHQREMPSV